MTQQPTTTSSLDRITFDFGAALVYLKRGKKVARTGWNGKGMWIAICSPGHHEHMHRPYIYMKATDDSLVPWVASQTDMLAEDWVLVH